MLVHQRVKPNSSPRAQCASTHANELGPFNMRAPSPSNALEVLLLSNGNQVLLFFGEIFQEIFDTAERQLGCTFSHNWV